MEQFNIISIIIAGITTGGLSCFAVQGGLLTSAIAQSKQEQSEGTNPSPFLPVLAFISSKVVVYTLFGALLGLFGSFFSISPILQGWIQVVVAIYMLGVALQLLKIHPIFRYFIIQPPASLQRLVRKVAKGNDQLTTPALLGFMTLVIPCGTTLAMEALAISTGNPFLGAAVMFIYTVSSSWVFFAAGYTASKLSESVQGLFYKITSAILIILAVVSFNGALNLLGAPYSLNDVASVFKPQSDVLGSGTNSASDSKKIPADFDNVQRVTIDVRSGGYKADTIQLKKGIPVVLTLKTQNSYSCANAFTIPSMDIQKMLPPTGEETITFVPEKSGQLPYTCSMGMYRGNFIVI